MTSPHVLVVGLSTRAAVESAVRAGYRVTSLDAFGDLDQPRSARVLSLRRDFGVRATAPAAARAASSIACHAVVYLSPFENHPRAVATLARGRMLWGNPADVLRQARDPLSVSRLLARYGLGAAREASASQAAGVRARAGAYLVKPFASGGGRRIRAWNGAPIPSRCHLQERIDGVPGSMVFAASGGAAVLLGVSRQIIGDEAFGASGYRYCGSILSAPGDRGLGDDDDVMAAAGVLADVLGRELGLCGLNGVDFVARRGEPVVVEVNPRWSASMELVERASGLSMFETHAGACAHGRLPPAPEARVPVIGKGVVFARSALICGDTRAWLEDDDIRDVPHPGESIACGQPVCTVFARGADAQACYKALVAKAAGIYETLSSWRYEPVNRRTCEPVNPPSARHARKPVNP